MLCGSLDGSGVWGEWTHVWLSHSAMHVNHHNLVNRLHANIQLPFFSPQPTALPGILAGEALGSQAHGLVRQGCGRSCRQAGSGATFETRPLMPHPLPGSPQRALCQALGVWSGGQLLLVDSQRPGSGLSPGRG